MNHCCVISCLNGRKNKTHKFFNFPPDPDRCAQWVEFCHHPSISERLTASGPYSLAKYGICSEHFDPAIVEEVMRKKIRLPADAVPDRIGRTFMTQKMLLDRGFSLDNYNLSSEGCRRLERSPVKHIDAVLVEMLDPDEMKQETAEEGSNFEFVRLKSDHQQFKFEDGFKKEYVDPGASHQPKKKCKMCSNFKPRYQYEVKKNKNLEEQINENKKQIADMSTKLQKMHDRITLRKARREELRKKYTELKNQKRGKGTTSLDISAEEANAADSEDDDASFDEATAWW
ncbi:uncharacterized protein LOC110676710 [Aedes aegypti]|uniref:Uncharacterized protein n=1 Tax=Aedes aegypti TaxID=7159 RepID=A0A6I8TT04_AEDAE|nr:uncharacterized protein LOC110676710 [Aedes aegypti]